MADLIVYPVAVELMAKGDLDLEADTIKAVLVCTNTSVDDEPNATTLAGFTTLDEYDGTSYARTALANKDVSINTAGQRIQFDADDISFGVIGAASRAAVGVLLVKHVNGGSADIPIAFQRFIANVNGDGAAAYTVTFPSGHIIHNSYPA